MASGCSRALVAAILAAWLLASDVQAQVATPTAAQFAVDPVDCTTEPRPINEMRALAEAGLADRAAREASVATPEPSAEARPLSTPLDAATVEAVTETVRQFIACSNAGNLPALSALTVDEVIQRQLAGIVLFMTQVMGGTPTPSNPDPAILDAFFAAIAFPVPQPEDEWQSLLAVDDVAAYEGGLVGATVAFRIPGASPEMRESTWFFQNVDGRYLVFSDSPSGTEPGTGTPVA